MLASITPLGQRGRGRRWAVTASAYLIGSVVGGAALFAMLGGLGAALQSVVRPGTFATWLLAAAAVIAATVDHVRPPWPLGPQRQVNEDWLQQYRDWICGLGYGVQLGAGVATHVTTAAIWAALAGAALSGSVGTGAAVGTAFGLARGAPLLLAARVRDAVALRRLHMRLASYDQRSRTGTIAVTWLTGGLLLVAAWRGAGR